MPTDKLISLNDLSRKSYLVCKAPILINLDSRDIIRVCEEICSLFQSDVLEAPLYETMAYDRSSTRLDKHPPARYGGSIIRVSFSGSFRFSVFLVGQLSLLLGLTQLVLDLPTEDFEMFESHYRWYWALAAST